eukprot:PhM_4_TR405/c2_g1_i2/m.76112
MRRGSDASVGSMRSRQSRKSFSVASSAGPRRRVTPGWANPTKTECAITSLAAAVQHWSDTLAKQYGLDGDSITPALRTTVGDDRNIINVLNKVTNNNHMVTHFTMSVCGCTSATHHVTVPVAATSCSTTRRPTVQALLSSLDAPARCVCPQCGMLTWVYTHPHIVSDERHLVVEVAGASTTPDGKEHVFSKQVLGASYNGASVSFRDKLWTVTSMLCHTPPTVDTPGHYYTIVPRGKHLFLVDEDREIRSLQREKKNAAFSEVALIFLAELKYLPAENNDDEPPAEMPADPSVPDDNVGSIATRVKSRSRTGHGHDPTVTSLSVAQLNIAGLTRSKAAALEHELSNDIVCLQETKSCARPPTSTFDVFDTPRRNPDGTANKHGGGTAIWVRRNIDDLAVSAHKLPTSPFCEATALRLSLGSSPSLTIISLYVPPSTKFSSVTPYLTQLLQLDDRIVLCADVNVHSKLWYEDSDVQLTDDPGAQLFLDLINSSQLIITNDTSRYTRAGLQGGCTVLTSPDITAQRGVQCTDWRTYLTPHSDHLRIEFTIAQLASCSAPPPADTKRFIFDKADWPKFRDDVSCRLPALPHNSHDVNLRIARLTSMVTTCARRHIPYGNRRQASPPWSAELDAESARLLQLRVQALADDSEPNRTVFQQAYRQHHLNITAMLDSQTHKTVKELSSAHPRTWRLLKSRRVARSTVSRPPPKKPLWCPRDERQVPMRCVRHFLQATQSSTVHRPQLPPRQRSSSHHHAGRVRRGAPPATLRHRPWTRQRLH